MKCLCVESEQENKVKVSMTFEYIQKEPSTKRRWCQNEQGILVNAVAADVECWIEQIQRRSSTDLNYKSKKVIIRLNIF